MDVALLLVVTLVGGFAVGGTALRLAAWLSRRRDLDGPWREAARRVGLLAVEPTDEGIGGWTGSLRVRLSRFEGANDTRGTRIRVSGPSVVDRLTVRAESLATGLLHRAGRGDVETGDVAFDRSVWVSGPETLALALLDAPTRASLASLVGGQLVRPGRLAFWADGFLDGGLLQVDVHEVPPDERRALRPADEPEATRTLYLGGSPDHLPEALDAVLALARRLAPPPDVPRRLAENFRTEPEPAVRLRLLERLTSEHVSHPVATECLRAALEDPDADVRVRAAVETGAAARPVLLAVARGEGALDATSARAIGILGASLSVAEATAVLRDALRLRKKETARGCLRALGARGAEAIAMLGRVLAVEREDVGEWAAEALAATGAPEAEPALVVALGAPDERRRAAAALALGRVGTVAAIPELRRLEEEDAGARAAARQAIAQIRGRAAGAEPGQLSLAGGETGRVSLADAGEAGRLSLATRPGGA